MPTITSFSMPDDVVQGLVAYLLQQTALTNLLGAENTNSGTPTPWIFQDNLEVAVQNTQSAAVVVSDAGGWSPPLTYNEAYFPRIRIDIWVDPPRVSAPAPFVALPNVPSRIVDARLACKKIGNVLDTFMHRPGGDLVMWRNVYSMSCVRLAEMSIEQEPEGNRLIKGSTFYGAEVVFDNPLTT